MTIFPKGRIQIGEKRCREQGIKIGEERGKEEGIQIGEAKGKAEVAKNLLKAGLAIDLIVKATGLSAEEIEKLK